mgnify:CR=1 FL=1
MSDDSLPVENSQPPGPVRVYSVVLGVGVLCSLAIVTVYEVTRPIIRENRIVARREAILDLLPGAESVAAFRWDEEAGEFQTVADDATGSDLVFAGIGPDGTLAGLTMAAQAMGYQDVIRILYGYSFDQDAVIGIKVLESRETPGLGDRIETDPDFLANFVRLDVGLNEDQSQLAHPIKLVKPGEKEHPWQIDGITGATISSQAIADMLRDSTGVWIPRVIASQSVFENGHEGG